MTQGKEWPVEFSFHSAEEETNEGTDALNCILCGLNHSRNECPNTVRVCKYCGGVGYHQEGIMTLSSKLCCINHSALTECKIK